MKRTILMALIAILTILGGIPVVYAAEKGFGGFKAKLLSKQEINVSSIKQMAINGNYLWLLAWSVPDSQKNRESVIQVFDISHQKPVLVATHSKKGFLYGVAFEGNKAYMLSSMELGSERYLFFEIFDVSNPKELIKLRNSPDITYFIDVEFYVKNGMLYVFEPLKESPEEFSELKTTRVLKIDLGDFSTTTVCVIEGCIIKIQESGDYLYALTNSGLFVFSIKDCGASLVDSYIVEKIVKKVVRKEKRRFFFFSHFVEVEACVEGHTERLRDFCLSTEGKNTIMIVGNSIDVETGIDTNDRFIDIFEFDEQSSLEYVKRFKISFYGTKAFSIGDISCLLGLDSPTRNSRGQIIGLTRVLVCDKENNLIESFNLRGSFFHIQTNGDVAYLIQQFEGKEKYLLTVENS
jgi:hypothetical protein